MYDLDELVDIIDTGAVDVKCTGCDEYSTIEPDAKYSCECGGEFISPLLIMGMI